MIRRLVLALLLLLVPELARAQTGNFKQIIMQDVTGAFTRFTRINIQQRDASTHNTGEVIWCTDCDPVGLWVYDGTQWVPLGGGGTGGTGDLTGSGVPPQVAFWTGTKTLGGDPSMLWTTQSPPPPPPTPVFGTPTRSLLVGTPPQGTLTPGHVFVGLNAPSNAVGMQAIQAQVYTGAPGLAGLVTLGDDRVGISSWNFRGTGATNPIYGANFGVVFNTNGVANGLEIDVQNDSVTNFQGQALWLNGSTRNPGPSGTVGHRANAILIDTQDGSKWERGILFKEGYVGGGATGCCEKMGIHFEQAMDSDFIVIQPRIGTLANVAMKLTDPDFTVNRFALLNSGAIRVGNTLTGAAFPSYAFVEDGNSGMYMEADAVLGFAVKGETTCGPGCPTCSPPIPTPTPPCFAGKRRMTLGDVLNIYPVAQTPDNTGSVKLWDQFSAHSVGLMAADFIGNSFRIRLPNVPGTAGQCLLTSGPSGSLGNEIETWSYGACGTTTPGTGGTVTNTAGALNLNALVVGNAGVDVKSLGVLGTVNQVLHGNAGGLPTWSAVNLAADVSGRLPYANFTSSTAPSRLLGRGSASAGDWQEITIGANLTLTGTVLAAAAATGAPPTAKYITQTPDATLSDEQALSLLPNGYMLNSTGGIITIQTATQLTASLDVFTSTLKGLAPASGGGTVNFLRADGTWAATPGITAGAALTLNQLVIGQGTTTAAALGTLGTATTVLHGGTGAPTFSAVSLTADVSGRLPYANIVAPSAAARLLGRGDTTGDWQEIIIGANLAMSGNTLNAAAGGGGAPITATYITQTPDATLTNEQALSLLTNGYMFTTGGVVSTQTTTQLTAALDIFTSALKGLVPASGGGTTNFLRADGNWAAPGGGGNVTTGTLTTNTIPRASGATAIVNSLLTDVSGLLSYSGASGTTALKAAFTNNVSMIVLGTTNTTTVTMAGLSADRTFTLPNANSNPVQPLTCGAGTFVSAIASTGVLTCTTPATSAGTVTHTAGALTINQLVIGNNTDDVKTLGALGTAVQVLHGNASGPPTWGAVALASDVSGRLPYANLTAATSASKLFGRGDSGLGDWQEITLGANLTMTGTTLAAATSGTGAPLTATYWTSSADASLSNEVDMSALGTGLVISTAGTPTIYGGTFCTGQFVRALNALGVATCASIANADLAFSTITVTGTPNRILVTGSPVALGGTVTLNGPQDIHPAASPAFSTLSLTASANQLVLGTTNATTVTMATLTAPRTFTLPNANSNPVQPLTCGAGQFVSAIASSGAITCTANPGGGTVTVSGTPVLGNLVQFFNATTIAAGNLFGDVTTAGTLGATIANDAVTNPKLANMATKTIKGRATAGTGDPEDLTAAQAAAVLAPGGTLTYLRSDGTWASTLAGTDASMTVAAISAAGGLVNVLRDYTSATPILNDSVGSLVFGQLNSTFPVSTLAQITSSVNGGAANVMGRLTFHTHDGTSLVERIRIAPEVVTIGAGTTGGPVLNQTALFATANNGGTNAVVRFEGTQSNAGAQRTMLQLVRSSTLAATDGFGPRLDFVLRSAGTPVPNVDNTVGRISVLRDGGDNTGALSIQTAINGALTERIALNGAGQVLISPTATLGELRLMAIAGMRMALQFNTDNNTSYVGLRAPTTSFGNLTWTLPGTLTAPGGGSGVLTTDASGNMSWASTAGAVSTTGTPLANQMTFFTGPNTISGSPSFAFNSSTGVLALTGGGALHVGITPFGGQAAGPVQSTVSNSDNTNPYQTLLGQIVNGSSAGIGPATTANDKVAVSGWAHRGAGGSSPIYGGNFTVKFSTTGPANGLELGVINVSGVNTIGNGLWVNGGIGGGGSHRDNAILIDTQDASKWTAGIRFLEGNTGLGASGSILNYGIIFDKSQDADFIVMRPRVGANNVAIRITNVGFTGNMFSVTNGGDIATLGVINASGNINTAGNIGAVQYFSSGIPGLSMTKNVGTCVFTITGGLITNITGPSGCG